MAGSMYPGQASLLDQTDSWNHRPQDMPLWQPGVEVSWASLGSDWRTDQALPEVPVSLTSHQGSPFTWVRPGSGSLSC